MTMVNGKNGNYSVDGSNKTFCFWGASLNLCPVFYSCSEPLLSSFYLFFIVLTIKQIQVFCPVTNIFKNMIYLAVHIMSALFLPFRKRLEQQQKMMEEDRKRRQFEEQKQKLRLLSSVKPKVSLSPHPVHFTVFLSACPLLNFVILWALKTQSFCTQTGEKSRDDALEAIKGNLDGFSRDAKMHPTPSSQTKKQGTFISTLLYVIPGIFPDVPLHQQAWSL